jgi:hypothetical protein
MKRVCAGEYEYKGWSISKDDTEHNLWWAKQITGKTETPAEDFWTLRDAKEYIGRIATDNGE